MKQNVNPVVAVIAAIVVFALVGFFMWQRATSSGLTKEQEQKFLTPLKMPPPGQAPSVVPPPPPGPGNTPILMPPGGAGGRTMPGG